MRIHSAGVRVTEPGHSLCLGETGGLKQPTALLVFAGWSQGPCRSGHFAVDEEVVDRDEDHGGQEAANEDLHQTEKECAPTDKGEARQQKLIEILHHPPVREQQAE